MSWQPSRLIRTAADNLAVACLLSLFAPWFALGAAVAQLPLMHLFWRLCLLVFAARIVALTLGAQLVSLPAPKKILWLVSIGSIGVVAVASTTFYPGPPALYHLHPLLLLSLGALAWISGLNLASTFSTRSIQNQLLFGTVNLGICLFSIYRLGHDEQVIPRVLPFLIFWFLAIIITASLIRIMENTAQGAAEGQVLGRFWPPLLVILAVICLVLALLFSIILPLVMPVFAPPARLLLSFLDFLLHIIAYIGGLLAYALIWVFHRFFSQEEWPLEGPQPFAPGEFILPEIATDPGAPLLSALSRWLGVGAVVLLVVFLTVLILLRKRKDETETLEETRESFASIEALRDWGRALFKGLGASLRRTGARLSALRPRQFASVREIYNAVLDLAARQGLKRPPGMTPHSFQPLLHSSFPHCKNELARFLEAFCQEYYGGRVFDQSFIAALVHDWHTMQAQEQKRP